MQVSTFKADGLNYVKVSPTRRKSQKSLKPQVAEEALKFDAKDAPILLACAAAFVFLVFIL